MAQAKNAVILSGSLGSSPPIYGSDRDIPEDNGFTKGKVDGTDSFYLVYSKPDFHDNTGNSSTVKIVETTSDVNLGFTARYTQGWDRLGISVLEAYWYGGTGRSYLHKF